MQVKASRTARLPDHYYNPKADLFGNSRRPELTPEELIRIPMSKSAYVMLVSLAKWDTPSGQYNQAHRCLKNSDIGEWHKYYKVRHIERVCHRKKERDRECLYTDVFASEQLVSK